MKRLLKYILIGFVSGAVVGNVIVILSVGWGNFPCSAAFIERIGSKAGALILQTLLSGLIGVAGIGGMLLYETDLPLAAAPVIHFTMIEAVFIPTALFLEWIPPVLRDIAIMTALMLVPFIIIWLIMFLRYKRIVKELNEMNRQ